MKQITIPLNNGYKIVISVGLNEDYPNEIRVEVYDKDDVWNQDLVRISNYVENYENGETEYNEEKFSIQVAVDEDTNQEFILDLHHDQEINDEDEDEDEDIPIVEEEPASFSLSYGARGEDVKKIQ